MAGIGAKRTLAGMLVRVRLLAQSGDAAGCVVITRTRLRLARRGLPDDAVDDGLRLPGVALAPEFLAAAVQEGCGLGDEVAERRGGLVDDGRRIRRLAWRLQGEDGHGDEAVH